MIQWKKYMEQKEKSLIQKTSELNMKRPGKIGVIFGVATGVSAGYTNTFQKNATELCPKDTTQTFKDCWDASAMGTVLAAMLIFGAIEGGIGVYRRRKAERQSGTTPGQKP